MTILPRLAVAAALAALACSRGGRAAPDVRVHVSADLPGDVLAHVAAHAQVARVRLVERLEDAEVAWRSDPAEALALGARLDPGSAPASDVPPRWRDPRGRFAPLGARARVLLVAPGAPLPFSPSNLRDLVDPRAKGRVAVAPLGGGAGPVTVASLSLAYGPVSTGRFLTLLARNAPRLAGTDAAVRAQIAAGEAALGLASSTDAAQAVASARPLDVVYPDQLGAGAIVLPTAVVVLGGAGEPARRLAEWLAGAEAERLLVARVPGLLPLRPEVPVPPGVEPAGNLVALALDWDALAAETARQRERLARWPDAFTSSHEPASR